MKFVCPLVVVDEIERSRHFYEQVLGMKVKFDFGQNVTFHGDFAIHLKSHYQSLLGDSAHSPVVKKAHWGELYFETDTLDLIYVRLQQEAVEFVHALREQPWGQRVMRFYDPDGHIVEIGETMEAVVLRFHEDGESISTIADKSSMPREFVEQVIQEHTESGCGERKLT